MSKRNKGGWIRHRGGKCPVETDVLVDVRTRDGMVWLRHNATQDCDWSHNGCSNDIMAYRLHKPEQVEPAVVDNGEQAEMPAAKYFDGPLQWRDRIREIDSTVEALEEERVSLVQKLESEGFRLIEPVKSCESSQALETWQEIAISPGGLVPAVKEFRNTYGSSLKEALEVVRKYREANFQSA